MIYIREDVVGLDEPCLVGIAYPLLAADVVSARTMLKYQWQGAYYMATTNSPLLENLRVVASNSLANCFLYAVYDLKAEVLCVYLQPLRNSLAAGCECLVSSRTIHSVFVDEPGDSQFRIYRAFRSAMFSCPEAEALTRPLPPRKRFNRRIIDQVIGLDWFVL